MSLMLDFRNILKSPFIYTSYQHLVGGIRARKLFIKNDAKITPTQNVLDIGCGPGDILNFLPNINYVGIDIDQTYIDKAKSKQIKNAKFYCTTFNNFKQFELNSFDVVISTGVLHHLNNDEAYNFFALAKKALKPSGKLVTYDGVFTEKQNPIAKKLLELDRGNFVRTEDAYIALAQTHFSTINTKIETTYFRIPYSSVIMTCKF